MITSIKVKWDTYPNWIRWIIKILIVIFTMLLLVFSFFYYIIGSKIEDGRKMRVSDEEAIRQQIIIDRMLQESKDEMAKESND